MDPKPTHEIHLCFLHTLHKQSKVILREQSVCFDCNLPREVRCAVVHLGNHVRTQKCQTLKHFRLPD